LLKLSKLLLKLCGIKWCYLANMRLVRGKWLLKIDVDACMIKLIFEAKGVANLLHWK
jgi:hypothetical protein